MGVKRTPQRSPDKSIKGKSKKAKSNDTLEDLSLEDVMAGDFSDDDEDVTESILKPKKVVKKKRKETSGHTNGAGPESKVSMKPKKVGSHKDNMEALKSMDPSFYKYLEQNDKDLLDFDASDDDDDNDEDEDPVHRPPSELEVASDESDFEGDDEKAEGLVTLKMIAAWEKKLATDKTTKTLNQVLDAFHAALQTVLPEVDHVPSTYRVQGASVFNAVIRLCIVHFSPALCLILNRKRGSKMDPKKNKLWPKVRGILLRYLTGLTKLCEVTSTEMLTVLLKHLHGMIPFAVLFSTISLRLMKRFVTLWVSESDVVRVLSFLCLLRLVNLRPQFYKTVLKRMYFAFVRNSKFVSPSTLTQINFMRRSLAEIFVLDPANSYEAAFLYIRQLSIHLRNAITLKKKEHYQAVHNWQFVQSLNLWCDVLGLSAKGSPLLQLVHPVVQITLGTIDLIPSAEFYPLRFHCCKYLLSMSEKTEIYVPVVPIVLEVLNEYSFDKKHTKVSMKPMTFRFSLRASKLQRQENGFKDAVIENIVALLLEAFTVESYRLSFPDVVVPAVIQMKNFLKVSKMGKYCKEIKSVMDKVLETSKVVETERAKAGIRLDDVKGVAAVETSIRTKGTPLSKYFETWSKLNQQQKAKMATENDKLGDYNLPTMYKFEKKKTKDRSEAEGPVELFPDDDESDLEIEKADVEEQQPRNKKEKKKKIKKTEETKVELPEGFGISIDDIVEDLNLSDLE